MGQITRLLRDWQHDEAAHGRLMELVYAELRRLASAALRRERQGHTLRTDDLVHETYLRLIDQRRVRWQGYSHFLRISVRMMRRILVNHARGRRCKKRGGGVEDLRLDELSVPIKGPSDECIAVDEALERLAAAYPQQAAAVELRYFGGLNSDEIASALGVSRSTVARRLRIARVWLFRDLREGHDAELVR